MVIPVPPRAVNDPSPKTKRLPSSLEFPYAGGVIPYRDLNPSRRFPFITVLLITANVAVFILLLLLPADRADDLIYSLAVIPLEFKLGRNLIDSQGLIPPLTIFTALFLHGGWIHLIGNMLYLWIFGGSVEGRMGPFRFLLFYLLCGLLATLTQVYGHFRSTIPLVGASGAIAGVLAAYLRLFPRAKIAVLIPIFYFFRVVTLPAWAVLGFWVLLQILPLQLAPVGETGGVAYLAHIGGFVAGLLFVPLFVRRKRR